MGAEETVLAFVAAWNALDWTRIHALMADDIVYHNMPLKPVQGRETVRAHLDAWPVDACEWRLLNIATNGNVVLTERVDRFVRGEDRITVPVMGAFDVAGGRITGWRDYFDMGATRPEPR
ncbi:MAG: Limonene,2-epoxide hydrolase [Sphingomonas bacterium]|jgi:limonene-1,2-epoxide hydrolase|uniref:limonene-1,2-epoxide hydrolase family protein n=1 Tax=Sphingomonas bacterium TaxID=1895847 RepID=UPI00262EC188|nr:limonene-1,2-epoxide hydrolase family protein [Sphingomonas bacterium]MDB5704222.1 Limonene,2-epoxide hydrolase [Sphingomonas bacterium]